MRQSDPSRILLVEDSSADARLIEEYVRERAWPQLEEPSPAIDRARRLKAALDGYDGSADVVLLDLGLPDSSGIETLDAMLAVTDGAPIVVLTGLDDEGLGLDAVERGAQNYLVKDDLTPKLLQQTLRFAIERERQQQRLQQRNQELAILNQIVRHDIRNDVAVIEGWADTLRDHVDPTGQEYVAHIQEASTHITGLTETAGEFLEVLEGTSEPDLVDIDVGRQLSAEVEKARQTYADATITLDDDLPAGTTVAATDLLSSVFRNLLSNAVVHNDTDHPEVTVTAAVRDGTVVVRVADNGPGVPDSRKDDIFGRSERGLQSPGSGIGLHLVDTLVEMYDGTVSVADNDSGGATFVVTLPLAAE
jgi:signal transduction histidine kinase